MILSPSRRHVFAGTALLAAAPAFGRSQREDLDVPYVPTPPAVVEGMLDLAALKAGERLIDLGSGDGRIPIAAAKRGASALGIEINPRLVSRARYLAELAGENGRAKFERADLFTVTLRGADVVTLYLLPDVNARLRSKLLVELSPGARVVSHAFDMGDWVPDVSRTIEEKNIYLWTIPAIAGGNWRLTRVDGATATLVIQQRYNIVVGTLDGLAIGDAKLHAATLRFTTGGITYRGTVDERTIQGDGWRADRVD